MGWSDCGTDDLGRPIGYAFKATCDHPECDAEIDRGLDYCCGGMHGGEPMQSQSGDWIENACGRYFCHKHLTSVEAYDFGDKPRTFTVCEACRKMVVKAIGDLDEEDYDGG